MFKTTRDGRRSPKIKRWITLFVDEENIPLVHQDDDYDDYETPNTSRIETSFTVSDITEATSMLRLRQKIKRDKINALYRHLNTTGNPDLIDLDRFKLTKDPKKGATIFEFYNGDRWVPLTKQTGDFFALKTLREKFGGLNIMKSVLSLDETPSVLKRSVKAASILKSELPTDLMMESIPLKDLSSLAEEIHIKTREASPFREEISACAVVHTRYVMDVRDRVRPIIL